MEHIIHLVLGKANPNRMNGVNKVVNSLAENQTILGHKVSVWGITKKLTHNYPSRSYATRLFKDVAKFKLSKELKGAIQDLKGEVVFHIHGGFIPQFYCVAKLLDRECVPYVFTPHGAYNSIALKRSSLKKKMYIKAFESFLVQNAEAIHLIGESEIDGTTATFGEVHYALIPNGQEQINFKVKDSKNRKNAPVFGYVGRLDAHTKGLDLLLKGFAQFIVKSGSAAQLYLVGDGPDKQDLEQLARDLKIEHQMKFLGAKYGSEKDSIVEEMDYLCLCSRNEGLPGVVLEAAALGTPSIVSSETNMGRYIQSAKSGFVLENNQAFDIASVLAKAASLIGTKDYQLQSEAAEKMIEETFNWRLIAQKHLDLYAA